MTTFYSEHPQSHFFNIPMLEAEFTDSKLKLVSDDIGFEVPVQFILEQGTEIVDPKHVLNRLRGFTLTLLYAKRPGYFELYFTNRFDTRIVGIKTPGTTLGALIDFHKIKQQDESRYRQDGVQGYNYADLFAREITQWPANRYLRTVVKHPWWTWVIQKDADGEDDMVLIMRSPHPADEDENYADAEVTREMWERARANFLIIDAVSTQVPRADAPSTDLYDSIVWLGHHNEVDLWLCNERFLAAAWTERSTRGKSVSHTGWVDRIKMFDLTGEINPSNPEWVGVGVRRIRAYHPQLDHLPFP